MLAAALLAPLAFASPAAAEIYTVNDEGDAPDSNTADTFCDSSAPPAPPPDNVCTLRAAIDQANATPAADTIAFAGSVKDILVAGGPLEVTAPVAIADDGDVNIDLPASAAGPALALRTGAAGSTLRLLRLKGLPASTGSLVAIEASRATADRLTLATPSLNGIELRGAPVDVALTQLTVTGAVAAGVSVGGSAGGVTISDLTADRNGASAIHVGDQAQDVTISRGVISATAGNGVTITGSVRRVTLDGASVSGSGGDGVEIACSASEVRVRRSLPFANFGKPISREPDSPCVTPVPADFRVGPRRADGSLPLTGSRPVEGPVELYRGDPFGASAASFLTELPSAAGPFEYLPSPEPPPGAAFAATLNGAGGTSEVAVARVPDDVISPDVVGARAISTTEVRVETSEPVAAASLAPEDFVLHMAGVQRTVTRVATGPGASELTLTSAGWRPGEAGFLQVVAAGAFSDLAGNLNLGAPRLRVLAAPGDFLAPIVSSLRLSPREICLTRGRGCRRTGTRVSFRASETGKVLLVVQRGNKRVGVRTLTVADPGRRTVRFDGRLRNRKLRAGRYRMLVYLEDVVGNETPEPAIALFSVRRTG